MKWDNVKKTVAREVYTTIVQMRDPTTMTTMLVDMVASGHFMMCREAGPLYADKAYEVILGWDVRMAASLRELFPMHFPPSLRRGALECFVDGSGDWVVERRSS